MRPLAFTLLSVIVSVAGCSSPNVGHDRCFTPQDCLRPSACIEGRCVPPVDGGPDAQAPDAPAPSVDAADGSPPPDSPAPVARDAAVDNPVDPPPRDVPPVQPDAMVPADAPADRPVVPADLRTPDVAREAAVCATCPSGGCPRGSPCCPDCAQGCQNGHCRIDIGGAGWRDYETNGTPIGHTMFIKHAEEGQVFDVFYTAGPRSGMENRGTFLDWNMVEYGVTGQVASSNLIVFPTGSWKR